MLIRRIDKYATNIDAPDSLETIATELRGFVPRKDGSLGERDFGTVHRYPTPPIRPNAFKVISGAANNGSGLIRLTVTGHGYATSDVVYVDEIGGTIEAKGKWTITKINNDTFDLQGSTFANAYTSGGITSKTPITIINGYTFTDTDESEYDIVVGLDSSNNMRIYVYDSGWIELTRKIDALINDTPGASDTNFDIDTITENAVTLVPTADEFNNWIVVNTSRSNQTILITDCTATNLTVNTIIGSGGLNWQNNDVLEIYRFPAIKYNYSFSNGATPFLRWMEVKDQRKIALLYSHTDGTKRQAIQIVKRAARNYFLGTSGSVQASAQIIFNTPLPDDVVYVVSDVGQIAYTCVASSPGAYEFTTADELAAAINLYNTDVTAVNSTGTITVTSNSGGTHGNTFRLEAYNVGGGNLTVDNASQSATSSGVRYFEGGVGSSTGLHTFASGWYVESDFGILNPFCVDRGALNAPINNTSFPTFTDDIYDKTNNRNWMRISGAITNYTAVDSRTQARVYITALFDDYQESDPIWHGFFKGNTDAQAMLVEINPLINIAMMNKNITGLRFYMAMNNSTAVAAGWVNSDEEYYLTWTLPIQVTTSQSNDFISQSVFQTNTSSIFAVKLLTTQEIVLSDNFYTRAVQGAQPTIYNELNHELDKTREYPTPRFAIKVARPQGSICVIDENDTTLRSSNRNGDNINEDDNYPNRSIDNEDQKLKIFLNSTGELLGLDVHNDQIQAFKRNEREYTDLQSGLQGIKPCDFVAKESLVRTPKGLSWAGDQGIYLLPDGYETEILLNGDWQNLYDGTLMATGSTPYVTSAARRAIKSYYSSAYKLLIYIIQLNKPTGGTEYVGFVYSFNEKPISGEAIGWYQRKFNIGSDCSVAYFSYRESDDSLTIAHSTGILKYPNRSGSYMYQDDVLINGASTQFSQNKGIPTRLKIMLGGFYGLSEQAVYDKFNMDFSGESISGTGYFNILFWLNKMSTVIETKTQAIDSAMDERSVPPIGTAQRMSVEINLTEGDEEDFKKFDISTIEVTAQQLPKFGNR